MKITIHRGRNQIGGSIIELASDTTKIILDAGSELEEEVPVAPEIEGLFSGNACYDAVFISHYHGDHLGLCDKVLPEIPIYIGRGAGEVTNSARRYLKKEEYRFSDYYESGKTVKIGDFEITPYLCDHSAFDAYMFHIACGGKTLVYSGDFRSNGRKSFPKLLERLPHADALIIEGTTLTRAYSAPKTEAELEDIAVEVMQQTDAPVFILQASTNIDRIVTAFKSARRCNRVLIQDLYTAEVASTAGKSIPNPIDFSGVRVFKASGGDDRHELLDKKYHHSKIGKKGIANQRFLLCVRPTMQKYLEGLSEMVSFEGGMLFYSMWDGYKEKEDIANFLKFMQEKGVRVVDLHTSGHADEKTIQALLEAIKPDFVIPVHTENAEWFDSHGDFKVIHDKEFKL